MNSSSSVCDEVFVDFIEKRFAKDKSIEVFDSPSDYCYCMFGMPGVLVDWENLTGSFLCVHDAEALYVPRSGAFASVSHDGSLGLLVDPDGTVNRLDDPECGGSTTPLIQVGGGQALLQWLGLVRLDGRCGSSDVAAGAPQVLPVPLAAVFPRVYVPFLRDLADLRDLPLPDAREYLSPVVAGWVDLSHVVDLVRLHTEKGKRWLDPARAAANADFTTADATEAIADLAETTPARVEDAGLALMGWDPLLCEQTLAKAAELRARNDAWLNLRDDLEYILITPVGIRAFSHPLPLPETRFWDGTVLLEVSPEHSAEYLALLLQSQDGAELRTRLKVMIATGDVKACASTDMPALPPIHDQVTEWVRHKSDRAYLVYSYRELARTVWDERNGTMERQAPCLSGLREDMRRQIHQIEICRSRQIRCCNEASVTSERTI